MSGMIDSLRTDNQFSFVCPIFNIKTRMGACVKLRDLVFKGQAPAVRSGCQAAIRCSKCPAAEMVRKYCYDKTFVNDHHGSMVPKEGKLMRVILERVRPTMMRENVLEAFNVSDTERKLLMTADERIDEQLKTAPGEPGRSVTKFEAAPRRKTKVEKVEVTQQASQSSALKEAAASGDLSAAINL